MTAQQSQKGWSAFFSGLAAIIGTLIMIILQAARDFRPGRGFAGAIPDTVFGLLMFAPLLLAVVGVITGIRVLRSGAPRRVPAILGIILASLTLIGILVGGLPGALAR